MPIYSMTGYGRGSASSKGIQADVELATVNRKQIDMHVNLPRALSSLQAPVHAEIQGAVSRGRLNGEITVCYVGSDQSGSVRVNRDLAEAYVKALRDAALSMGLADDVTAASLLRLPGVVEYEAVPANVDIVWPVLRRALRAALRELTAMRRAEGVALAAELKAQLEVLAGLLDRFRSRAPQVSRYYRELLTDRLQRLGFDAEASEERILREIAVYADRIDIAEEIARLESHIQQARRMIKSTKTAGKSLDFLAQEMFREVNTIGSKANDANIAQWVVQGKTALDRFREQVQNVE